MALCQIRLVGQSPNNCHHMSTSRDEHSAVVLSPIGPRRRTYQLVHCDCPEH